MGVAADVFRLRAGGYPWLDKRDDESPPKPEARPENESEGPQGPEDEHERERSRR